MVPKWNAELSTVEHIMDRMLGVYSTKLPVSKAMDLMCEPKASSKTWTEHFKYLVYVEKRAGNDRTCWSCGGIGNLKYTFSADKVIDDAKVTLAIDTYCETLSTALTHGRQPKEARYVQRNEEHSSCALSNIISYASLEKKGAYLTRHGSLSYVERAADENHIFGVRGEGRVL
ncbi:unnamed protein product [Peronospora farinosa]|uniref:Uncharacterized protein n=1 Tax=Peronospora farinosa TaxID=134698 RepID=A0AAV0TBN0_9STRA|nr:unnamed protein product [Peronospora farinosa]